MKIVERVNTMIKRNAQQRLIAKIVELVNTMIKLERLIAKIVDMENPMIKRNAQQRLIAKAVELENTMTVSLFLNVKTPTERKKIDRYGVYPLVHVVLGIAIPPLIKPIAIQERAYVPQVKTSVDLPLILIPTTVKLFLLDAHVPSVNLASTLKVAFRVSF